MPLKFRQNGQWVDVASSGSVGDVPAGNDGWVVEDLPPPPELTPEEKLANAGLSIEELKVLLGIS